MLTTSPRYEDFDDWAQLARTDPQAFERRRRAVIDAVIDSAPTAKQQRLRRLQWRIDTERARAPNPTAACVKIYSMMWESFAGEHGLVAAFEDPGGVAARRQGSSQSSAKVLPFSRRD